jgi:5-formyltetrahydrofolate cyclo-ligase
MKTILRRRILETLSNLPQNEMLRQGYIIQNKLLRSEIYKRSRAIGIYISTEREVPTRLIIDDILQPASEKICYVPQVLNGTEMRLVRVYSLHDLESFPFNKWSIPEPPKEDNREDALESVNLDLLIVPGIAFDKKGRRLGRGKGFYDRFIQKCEDVMALHNKPKPILVGLAFSQQIVDEIPVDPHDKILDYVLTPNDNNGREDEFLSRYRTTQ